MPSPPFPPFNATSLETSNKGDRVMNEVRDANTIAIVEVIDSCINRMRDDLLQKICRVWPDDSTRDNYHFDQPEQQDVQHNMEIEHVETGKPQQFPSKSQTCMDSMDETIIKEVEVSFSTGISKLACQELSLLGIGSNKMVEPQRTGFLAGIVTSTMFEKVVALIIIVDNIVLAMGSDYEMAHDVDGLPKSYEVIAWTFLIFYTVEIILRLAVHRRYFFLNKDLVWNWFDSSIVVVAWIVMILQMVWPRKNSLGWMNILKILKLVKIVRTVRVMEFLHELRTLLYSLRDSAPPLFWMFVMLVLTLYWFALIFMHAISSHLATEDVDSAFRETALKYYGTLGKTMLTLYKSVSGGTDWEITYAVVERTGYVYGWTFVSYIFFFSFCLFNLLTATFVEKTRSHHQQNLRKAALNRNREMMNVSNLLTSVFLKLSEDGKTLTRDTFEMAMTHQTMIALMASLDIEVTDAHMFFQTMAGTLSSNAVPVEKFVSGCMQMHGPASGVDIHKVLLVVDIIQQDLHLLIKSFEGRLDRLDAAYNSPIPGKVNTKGKQPVTPITHPQTPPHCMGA